jgi:hypothetical protein
MTADTLDQLLAVLRKHNVMTAHIDGDKLTVTMGPDAPPAFTNPEPGGWKTEPSDPLDPDPLGLGTLDAGMSFDDEPTDGEQP